MRYSPGEAVIFRLTRRVGEESHPFNIATSLTRRVRIVGLIAAKPIGTHPTSEKTTISDPKHPFQFFARKSILLNFLVKQPARPISRRKRIEPRGSR